MFLLLMSVLGMAQAATVSTVEEIEETESSIVTVSVMLLAVISSVFGRLCVRGPAVMPMLLPPN